MIMHILKFHKTWTAHLEKRFNGLQVRLALIGTFFISAVTRVNQNGSDLSETWQLSNVKQALSYIYGT